MNPPTLTTLYIGCYTKLDSRGIHVCALNNDTGKLALLQSVPESNSTFLALHPAKHVLYSVSETTASDGTSSGAVSAYSIDASSGHLTVLNRQPAAAGRACHVNADAAGRYVVLAHYSGGAISLFPLNSDSTIAPCSDQREHHGSSVNVSRQERAHPHSVVFSPEQRRIFVPDLGMDRIVCYRVDEGRRLVEEPAGGYTGHPGGGPRHMLFNASGQRAYVINELDSTITVLAYDRDNGKLEAIETVSTLPEQFTGGNTCAEIRLSRDGRFLYGSNRGHDSIAVFAVDEQTDKLTAIGHTSTEGRTPRNFALSPDGRFLLAANQDSHNVVVFQVNEQSGQLSPTGEQLELSMPVCITFHH